MKLDDRFMAIMTMLLLLIGGGAVLQNGDGSLFGGNNTYEPRPDAFTLRAGRVQALDVLLNDLNADTVSSDDLKVMAAPVCGMALAVNGAIQYSESELCAGTIELSYCVPFEGNCAVTPITLTLLQNNDLNTQPVAAANADGSPVIVDVIQMGRAPQAPGAVVAARPARLSMPTDSEVITPSAATAEVRRIGEESGRSIVAAAGSDAAVSVSNTSARSGRVSTAGISMAAPDPVGESSGVAIASAGSDNSPRGTAPAAPGGLAIAGASPSRAPTPGFTRPERPDGGGAVTANVNRDVPSGMTAPSLGGGQSVDVAVAETTGPETQAPAQSAIVTGQEVALAPDAQTSPKPERMALTDATDDDAPTQIATLTDAPDADRDSPIVAEPSAAASEVEVETADTARPAETATPNIPADLTESAPTEVASLSTGDETPAQGTARVPTQPSEVERIARAPDAQVVEPSGPLAPETVEDESGVIASLVRSNTLLGATFSAAKALLGPSEATPAVQSAPAGATAPRPAGSDESPVLAETPRPQPRPEAILANGGRPVERPETEAPIEVAALDTSDETFVRRTQPAESPLEAFMRESGAVMVEQQTPVTAEPAVPEVAVTEPATTAPATLDTVVAEEPVVAPVDEVVPEVEVAALSGGTAETASEVAAPVTQGVRLALPEIAEGGSLGTQCEIKLGLQVQVGAEIIATVYSGCRPETQFIVDHAGLVFSAETDIDGVANFVVPAMTENADVTITFPDGAAATDSAIVEGMSRMTRVAMVWTDDIPFDVHALEFGAEFGSDSDVWSGNARNYRLARRSGGGYITELGPQSGPGVRAEVYTLFESLRTEQGVVEFDITLSDPEAECTVAPVIRVLRSETTKVIQNRDIRIDPAACSGATLSDVGIGLQDIRIARDR